MKTRLWLGGACLLLLSQSSRAETPQEIPESPKVAPVKIEFASEGEKSDAPSKSAEKPVETTEKAPTIDPLSEILCPVDAPRGPRIWIGAESLLWWMKPGPVPPLVTRGNPNDAVPGALGQSGTQVLFGGFPGSANEGAQAGLRLNLGAWLDEEQTFGVETSALMFAAKSGGAFYANGDFLYLPSQVAGTNGPGTYVISDSNIGYSGHVSAVSQMRFWGVEGNSLFNLYRGNNGSITALGGLRYFDLSEELTETNYSADTLFGGSTIVTDTFHTRNQFLGGQLGLQADLHEGIFFASVRSTVALGGTHQSREARGLTSGDASPAGTFPHGYYVQSSNTGRFTENDFSVVPQIGLKLGMDVLPSVRIFAGYDFLYWTNVLRPGDQIDQTVNISQSYGRTLSGPARPAFISRSSDFWAHGVNLGLQLRY